MPNTIYLSYYDINTEQMTSNQCHQLNTATCVVVSIHVMVWTTFHAPVDIISTKTYSYRKTKHTEK